MQLQCTTQMNGNVAREMLPDRCRAKLDPFKVNSFYFHFTSCKITEPQKYFYNAKTKNKIK